ncbi:MAG: tetratricopeptide repeat protein [Syntrophaceae bacterium]|nr:tetratricopeptide repeat protein [Syntrophaceae bacterium]
MDKFLVIEEAQEILKRDPKSIQAHLALGNAYLLKRDIPKAGKSFEEVIQIAPDNPAGYFHKGRILLAQRNSFRMPPTSRIPSDGFITKRISSPVRLPI